MKTQPDWGHTQFFNIGVPWLNNLFSFSFPHPFTPSLHLIFPHAHPTLICILNMSIVLKKIEEKKKVYSQGAYVIM